MVHVIVLVVALVLGCGSVVFLKKDSIPEQVAERLIKNETGVDVDFSCCSKEE